MKKALVTGAAGFIGSHVVRELLKGNVEVRAMIRPQENTRNLDGLDIEEVEGDVLDRSAVDRALEGVDTLFHLAAIYQLWLKNRKSIYDVNLEGTRNVLWAALKKDLEKVVYTSSIAGIGIAPGKEVSNEETPFTHWDAPDYVRTKYLSQEDALGFARNGLPLTVVNPAFPFGARDVVPTPTGRLIVDCLNGKIPALFEMGFCAVDVEDVAKGHVLAAKNGRVGQMYILGNENLAVKDFYRRVGKVAGVRAPTMMLPASFAVATAFFMEKRAERTGKTPTATPTVVRYSNQYLYYDNSKARNELGLEPTPIDDSIRRAVEWFRENGYAKKSA